MAWCIGLGLGCSRIQLYMMLMLQPGTSSLLISQTPGFFPPDDRVTTYFSYLGAAMISCLLFQLFDDALDLLFMAFRTQGIGLRYPLHLLEVFNDAGQLVPGNGKEYAAFREQPPRFHPETEPGDGQVHLTGLGGVEIKP